MLFQFLGLLDADVLVAGFADPLFQVFDGSFECGFIFELFCVQNALDFLLGLAFQAPLQVFPKFEILFLFDELFKAHLRSLLLKSDTAKSLPLCDLCKLFLALFNHHVLRKRKLYDVITIL